MKDKNCYYLFPKCMINLNILKKKPDVGYVGHVIYTLGAYAKEIATTNYDFKQITTDFNTTNIVEK